MLAVSACHARSHHRYIDPLTQVWLGAARRIGLRVVRTPDAYAATDGRGTLAIGDDATLDADDSLAQMIFHELCHSLVEGEDVVRARPTGAWTTPAPITTGASTRACARSGC